MNYRHAFHAGNHADVLKHLVLTRLIALMARKEQPFAYLDSHAGIGLYDLKGDQASRRVLHEMNPDGELRYYPGSPELARRLTREQDRVLINEKHPEDGKLLKDNMKGDRRVAVHLGEGWHLARALLPVAEKRAVMLIDPPFEQLDEMQRCAASLKETIGRMRQTVAAIWYRSGLAIANPPWGLEEELRELLPWLAQKLAQTQGDWRMDWLIAE